MVKVTPFILSLVIILFSGCGKSMEDVSGVYETEEIKTPRDGTRSWHHSTKWILDLSESGKFTLKQEKFRVPTQDKKYSPVPMTGESIVGDWIMNKKQVTLSWNMWVDSEAVPMSSTLKLENAGDLFCTAVTEREPQDLPDGFSVWHTVMLIENKRFKPSN